MIRPAPFVVFLLLLQSWSGTAVAERVRRGGREAVQDELREELGALRSDAVDRLMELAEWCQGEKLYGRRAAQYEGVLAFDADHAEARRQLGYRRKDGSWTRSRSYRAPRDRNPEALEAFRQRRDAAMAELVRRGLELIDGAPELPGPQRCAIVDELLVLAPEDDELRRRRGEARRGDSWILEDSLRSIERRRSLMAFLARQREQLEPERVAADDLEGRIGLEWTAVYRTAHFRVLGTVEEEELREAAMAAESAYALYRHWFPGQPVLSYDYRFYVLPGAAGVKAIVAGYPDCATPVDVIPRITGLPATGEVYVEYSGTREQRLDNVAHMAAAQMFWAGIPSALPSPSRPKGRHQWANQATGHTFSLRILGTRLSQRIGRRGTSSKKQDYSYLLGQEDASWLRLFQDRMAETPRPDLTGILARDFSDLDAEDMMVAFAVWTYLVESRPDDAARLLAGIATGRHPTAAVVDVLGLTMDGLLERVERWARETEEIPFHK